MAVKAQGNAAARQAFTEMGIDWDKGVWVNTRKYEGARNWALSE